jgi:hypothetical protein
MKKILIAILLLPQGLFAQKLERYCELVAIGKMLSSKVSISVDFGEEAGLFKDRRVKDDDGKVVKFNTLVDALNYMGTQNWKMVNAFPISNGNGGNIYHFFFKKEYDASELAAPETK